MAAGADDMELKTRALAGARRAAADLHSHEKELSKDPAYLEGAKLTESAAQAADAVARLLERGARSTPEPT